MKISMERYGETGWQFTVDGTEYRTDKHGDGLWVYAATSAWYPDTDKSVYEFQQTLGTCQFSLGADRKRAYGQIRRHFTPRDD
jgi:hypothetical protein